jgi:hypothetical protein
MSSPLEKFILENRGKFDEDSPNPRLWEKINERIETGSEKVTPLRSMPFNHWMAAAAAVVLVALSAILYYAMHSGHSLDNMATTKQKTVVPGNNLPKPNVPADSPANVTKTNPVTVQKSNTGDPTQLSPDNEDSKEMYYYAKLIELKHEELKTLEKDEPLLYRQFSGDVQKLNNVYHSLKTQLPNNSNREQVIEAMISNLQLQIGLLNKQLDIIKQIKHSKKSAYEKAYKSA